MAQRVVTILTDDLDNTPIEEGSGGETLTFGLDGTDYQIDLTKQHAADLRETLASYVAVAHRVGGRRARGRSPVRPSARSSAVVDPKEVRAWAQANNVTVSERGRVPESVIVQFKEATG